MMKHGQKFSGTKNVHLILAISVHNNNVNNILRPVLYNIQKVMVFVGRGESECLLKPIIRNDKKSYVYSRNIQY